MKNGVSIISCGLLLLTATSAGAHFGMMVADSPTIDAENRTATLTLAFSHPFEQKGMDLERPKMFSVISGGETTDLLSSLTPVEVMGKKAWSASYTFPKPGVYQFTMEPTPYWEPAEDLFIVHYTKLIIPAYGDEDGWQEPAGLKTEIIPKLRPFGNYVGNSFSGQVLLNGKPVANAEIEVEFNNTKRFSNPSDYHITQVVQADDQGYFSFTCPLPGWWGFSALNAGDFTISGPDGKEKEVELGAVLWLYFDPLPTTPAQ